MAQNSNALQKFYHDQINSPIKNFDVKSEIFSKHSTFLIADTQEQKNKQVLGKHSTFLFDLGYQKHNIPSLRSHTRRIAKSVIDKRWIRISESSLMQIVEILKDIERPVIMSIRHKTRRTDAQRNLNIMISKIRDRLSKLLVPPSSKEPYNYEKLREKNKELESILISNLEQISRLEKTLDYEKNLLAKEETDFQELVKNAQYNENSRKQQLKKLHPLLRLQDNQLEPEFSYTQINLNENNGLSSYDASNDKSYIVLEKQLKQYINSMKLNSSEVEKIIQSSQKAQTALLKILELYDHSLLHRILIETCI
ncbi:hypothetical protein PMAC_001214 [Pneumocystis sp. 'macacae']|nr:hypothetical protein PMAC_001214 [Pneumocystis sp. 'macacae']